MNFLELCNRVRQESGISGGAILTVVGQQGIIAKVVEWVRQADLDIKGMRSDWTFLWRMSDATLITDQRLYSRTDLGIVDLKDMMSLELDGDVIYPLSWQDFKAQKYHIAPDSKRPTCYAFRPDGLMMFFPVPDQAYVLSAEYAAEVTPLLNDTDVSPIPVHLHDVILQKALMYYASHEEDNSLYQVANQRFEEYLTRLSAECLPAMTLNKSRLF